MIFLQGTKKEGTTRVDYLHPIVSCSVVRLHCTDYH